ncbi:short-chain dehydrogenase/reductase SDR [Naematelia encephala]|uniref:Short-chain dehydrogenase/reductase SDR n=1 Tax=Naematelia encephala TaxID=71784 RepID=A0A1Y2BM63_9TREE|nr:short-chain dehydrogenase/reductase SDR [Naematelia encephala]
MPQTVLITGTSTGLGRSIAKLFQSKGWNVVATMRSPSKETELDKLENTLVTRLDVQDIESIDAAVAAGIAKFGRIDVLVNNAGYGTFGALEATSSASIRRQFDVNLFGLLDTTKALLPHFHSNHSGIIINISSVGGRIAVPIASLYHGTKWAVEGISESLQFELAPLGIKIKLIEPGGIKTDYGTRSREVSGDPNDPKLADYQPIVDKLIGILEAEMKTTGAEPDDVAQYVYTAATDGTDQLRYEAGPTAKQFLDHRRAVDDPTWFAGLRAQFL